MTIKKILFAIIITLGIFVFLGCDPIYPPGNLNVESLDPISEGVTITIDIIYPEEGGSIVMGWKNQNIEILSGDDILSVSGLSITGLKPGIAKIRVNATTIISEEAKESGREERVYSVELFVTVQG